MAEVSIQAQPRTPRGKGGARQTRREGRVPGVLYGHGAEPRHLSLPARELATALRHGGGANTLLRVQLDGASELTLPKEIQRDVLRGDLEHIDLLVVRRGERVTVDVRIVITGETPRDALVTQQSDTLSVEADATAIPTDLEVSVEGVAVGDSILASAVGLPDGVTLAGDPDAVLVGVVAAPTAEQVEAELEEAEAEVGAGAAGAAAHAAEAAEAAGEPTGEGDVVPDTDSAAGRPSEPPTRGTDAQPTAGG